jgi:transcriptional regulator with XRE-family HTH domain
MSYIIQTPSQLAMHLKALRQANALTQADLARKLNLSQARVARIEHDPLSISVGQFMKVLDALNSTMALDTDRGPRPPISAPKTTSTVARRILDSVTRKSNAGDW